MRYIILKWNDEKRTYEVVHWCHDYRLYIREKNRFPFEQGYIHCVEITALQHHDTMSNFANMVAEARKALEAQKK